MRHTSGTDDDIDEEHLVVRWVDDPSGASYRVQLVRSSGVISPVVLAAPGSGRVLTAVLALVNRGLVRVQRPRSVEGCSLQVYREDSADDESIVDDNAFDEDWESGRRRVERVVREIRDGTFRAPQSDA